MDEYLERKVFTKRVHVFKAGPQTSAQGVERSFTPEDLQQVVESYDPGTHEAPLVIGHSGDNDSTPSYGWIKKFVRQGDDLYADVNFTDVAKDLVKDGHYRKVSISFYSPESPINPHKGKWSARHLALLGAAPPAVKGLEPFSFNEREGVFEFATKLSPEDIFDKELGPTMILERGPLEVLRDRLQEVRGDIDSSIQELKDSQAQQTETEVGEETTDQADGNAAPENPNQQFSEMKMKKKMGREGAEVSESAQKLANMETMAPDDTSEERFDEGTSRKMAKGAHGQKVQVVQEVFEEMEGQVAHHGKKAHTKKGKKAMTAEHSDMEMEESDEDGYRELPPALRKRAEMMKAQAMEKDSSDEDADDDYRELPPALRKRAEMMKAQAMKKKSMADEEVSEDEDNESDENFGEVSYKVTENGKVSFRKRAEKDASDPAGRGQTARSDEDGYGQRQKVGKGAEEDRDGVTADGDQDEDRVQTAEDAEQDADRVKLAKATAEDADGESRWADQPEGKSRAMNADQFDDGAEGLPKRNKPGISDGNEPHGRDGGPTEVSSLSEEEPDGEDIVVPLQSTKGNKTVRVLHTESGQKRAALKGGAIADHSEESDGVTRTAKKAGISDGTDPHGRDGGPTKFPTRSEEEPDDLEMAVDLEDATESDKVRIIRQKSGDMPSTDHSEEDELDEEEIEEFIQELYGEKDPYSRTGKGSTYGQKRHQMMDEEEDEDEDEEDFSETEDFCGMGSMGQARAMGFPQQMYEELMNLKAENDRLKRDYEEQKIRSRKERIAQFVDSLYTEGKLTDGIMPQRDFQKYCEGLELGTLEFAEGETPTSKLFEMLSRLPNLVYYGEVVSEGPYQTPDEEDLDPHERAMKMVVNGEASDYVEAIKRCIPWGR